MYCSDCYVPFEKRDDFDYVATGKTSGHVKLPNGICGICGESTVQPYPTGLWIHYQEDADEDEYQTFDHVPRQANILELLMIKSEDEHKKNGIGGIEWYHYDEEAKASPYCVERGVMKDRHTECLIHKKYWAKELKQSKKDTDKLVGNPDGDYGYKSTIDDFIMYSERENTLQFKEFITNNKIKKLPQNPPVPITHYEFYIIKGIRHPESILVKKLKESNLDSTIEEGEPFRVDGKTYYISSINDRHRHKSKTKNLIQVHLKTQK